MGNCTSDNQKDLNRGYSEPVKKVKPAQRKRPEQLSSNIGQKNQIKNELTEPRTPNIIFKMPCESFNSGDQNQDEVKTPLTAHIKKDGLLNESLSDNQEKLSDDISTQNQSEGELLITTFDEEFEFEEFQELRFSSQIESSEQTRSSDFSQVQSDFSAPNMREQLQLDLKAVFAMDDKFGINDVRPRCQSTRFVSKELKRPYINFLEKNKKMLTDRSHRQVQQLDKNESDDIDDELIDFKGAFYSGQWKDGMKHGLGTCRFTDGTIYIGRFKNNQFHGKGSITYPGGRQYIGRWRDGKKHGCGKEITKGGVIVSGQWNDGKHQKWN